MIVLNSTSFNFEIDDYKINMYENVKQYKYKHCIPELEIDFSEIILNNDKEQYYVFDCPGQTAFAHWIYESFIFIPIFIKIKSLYPNIKILTSNTKKYVYNFFNFYNINNEIINEIRNTNNICFFSPIFSLNDANINIPMFINHIDLFTTFINNNINKNNINNKESLLFLPRNNKENYINNDRTNLENDDICNNVIKIGGSIIDTYQLNNIKIQFSLINMFKTIILDYGSSFFVNSIFLQNKNIIVIDICHYSFQINNYISMKTLFEYIQKKNNITIIKSNKVNSICFNDIKTYL